ncbi:PE family protein [Mycobacterium sp. 1245805.9]|uniref:PE family protein n=1 Tax=Mycobacterium sp. 1245805.9 TaxID=1856862 RepID=UPI0009ED5D47|nr:PE family protein [Mycobacterium sp. 1245805.9]
MSFLDVAPDSVAAAAGDLHKIGTAVKNANALAAAQTTAIAAPAADEVSAAITELFGAQAQEFQALNANASVFHDRFVSLLSGGAAQYLSAEVANAQQTLLSAVGTGQATTVAAADSPLANAWNNVTNTVNGAWNNFKGWAVEEGKSLAKDFALEKVENFFGFYDTGFKYSVSTTPDSVQATGGRTVTLVPHTLFGDGPTVTVASVQGIARASSSGGFLQVVADLFGLRTTVTATGGPQGLTGFSVTPGPNPFANAFWSGQTAVNTFNQFNQ